MTINVTIDKWVLFDKQKYISLKITFSGQHSTAKRNHNFKNVQVLLSGSVQIN